MWRLPGYSEVRELGVGAQGRVVLARHDASGSIAAIKYVSASDEGALRRFREEAAMLARARDPHVANLYGFVETPQGAALVMEAVDGVSLRVVLSEHGVLAPEAALVVLKGSLLGLAAAHRVGVVHRDYKPANVVVQGDGRSKLIDFGVAVLAGQGSPEGTPAYMAPEQWRGQAATPATDVYAATCVFFECVTGRRPYRAAEQVALMAQHVTAPVPLEEVPEPLRGLVVRGMAKDPAHRPEAAAAFVSFVPSPKGCEDSSANGSGGTASAPATVYRLQGDRWITTGEHTIESGYAPGGWQVTLTGNVLFSPVGISGFAQSTLTATRSGKPITVARGVKDFAWAPPL